MEPLDYVRESARTLEYIHAMELDRPIMQPLPAPGQPGQHAGYGGGGDYGAAGNYGGAQPAGAGGARPMSMPPVLF